MRLATVATPDGGDPCRRVPGRCVARRSPAAGPVRPARPSGLARGRRAPTPRGRAAGRRRRRLVNPLPAAGQGHLLRAQLRRPHHRDGPRAAQPPHAFAKYADTLDRPGRRHLASRPASRSTGRPSSPSSSGSPLRGATEEQARSAIAGYTVANDISVRDWQHRTLQWFQGKAWDAHDAGRPRRRDPRRGRPGGRARASPAGSTARRSSAATPGPSSSTPPPCSPTSPSSPSCAPATSSSPARPAASGWA